MITNMQLSDGSLYQIGDIETIHYDDDQTAIQYKNGIQMSLVGSNVAVGNTGTYKINLKRPFVEDSFVTGVVSANMSKRNDESDVFELSARLNSYLQLGSVTTWNCLYVCPQWLPNAPNTGIQAGFHAILFGRWK